MTAGRKEGAAVDQVEHLRREAAASEAAASCQTAPLVPSCPEWVVTDLVLHLGVRYRSLAQAIARDISNPALQDRAAALDGRPG
jgi:hypothetical protein